MGTPGCSDLFLDPSPPLVWVVMPKATSSQKGACDAVFLSTSLSPDAAFSKPSDGRQRRGRRAGSQGHVLALMGRALSSGSALCPQTCGREEQGG